MCAPQLWMPYLKSLYSSQSFQPHSQIRMGYRRVAGAAGVAAVEAKAEGVGEAAAGAAAVEAKAEGVDAAEQPQPAQPVQVLQVVQVAQVAQVARVAQVLRVPRTALPRTALWITARRAAWRAAWQAAQ